MTASVFVATPCHRATEAAMRDLDLFTQQILAGVGGCLSVVANCPWLDAARADLVAAFLQSKMTHLLFRDDDIFFEADVLKRMLDLNQPIVVAPYRARTQPHPWVLDGLGCALFKRATIETMAASYPELAYDQDESPRVALFHHIIRNRRLIKEDQAFFHRARECGYKAALLDGAVIRHNDVVSTYNALG